MCRNRGGRAGRLLGGSWVSGDCVGGVGESVLGEDERIERGDDGRGMTGEARGGRKRRGKNGVAGG
jgi:hypothetical protein